MRTEAEVLNDLNRPGLTRAQAMALGEELSEIQMDRTAAVRQSRELDLSQTVIGERFTPVLTHSHHTAATDWIEDAAEPASNDYGQAVTASAAFWFGRLHEAVVADAEEFTEQARGMARREAGVYGHLAKQAEQTFMDEAARLRAQAVDGPDGDAQSGNAESGLEEVEVGDPGDKPMDPLTPIAPTGPYEVPSTRAPNVNSSAAKTAAEPIADESGTSQSGLPVVTPDNEEKPDPKEVELQPVPSGAADVANTPNPNDHTSAQHTAGNPYPVGTGAWFDWEAGGGDPASHGPHSGVPEDLFPGGGVPLRGPLTPEQEAWMRSRSSLRTQGGPPTENDEAIARLTDPAERKWLTDVSPESIRDNAHRIYDFMEEAGIPQDSYTRELAFAKASDRLGIDYNDIYDAWLDERPMSAQGSLRVEAVTWGRRHYEDLAETIAAHPDRANLAKHFGSALAGSNPNFRQEQFEKAASTPGYKVRGGTGTATYSRGHYQAIANAIKSYPGDKTGLADHFAKHFSSTSSTFKRDVFLKATSGLKVADVDWDGAAQQPIQGPGTPPPNQGQADPARGDGPAPYNAAPPNGAPAVTRINEQINNAPVLREPGAPGSDATMAFRRRVQAGLTTLADGTPPWLNKDKKPDEKKPDAPSGDAPADKAPADDPNTNAPQDAATTTDNSVTADPDGVQPGGKAMVDLGGQTLQGTYKGIEDGHWAVDVGSLHLLLDSGIKVTPAQAENPAPDQQEQSGDSGSQAPDQSTHPVAQK